MGRADGVGPVHGRGGRHAAGRPPRAGVGGGLSEPRHRLLALSRAALPAAAHFHPVFLHRVFRGGRRFDLRQGQILLRLEPEFRAVLRHSGRVQPSAVLCIRLRALPASGGNPVRPAGIFHLLVQSARLRQHAQAGPLPAVFAIPAAFVAARGRDCDDGRTAGHVDRRPEFADRRGSARHRAAGRHRPRRVSVSAAVFSAAVFSRHAAGSFAAQNGFLATRYRDHPGAQRSARDPQDPRRHRCGGGAVSGPRGSAGTRQLFAGRHRSHRAARIVRGKKSHWPDRRRAHSGQSTGAELRHRGDEHGLRDSHRRGHAGTARLHRPRDAAFFEGRGGSRRRIAGGAWRRQVRSCARSGNAAAPRILSGGIRRDGRAGQHTGDVRGLSDRRGAYRGRFRDRHERRGHRRLPADRRIGIASRWRPYHPLHFRSAANLPAPARATHALVSLRVPCHVAQSGVSQRQRLQRTRQAGATVHAAQLRTPRHDAAADHFRRTVLCVCAGSEQHTDCQGRTRHGAWSAGLDGGVRGAGQWAGMGSAGDAGVFVVSVGAVLFDVGVYIVDCVRGSEAIRAEFKRRNFV